MIVALAGGVGGAKMAEGLMHALPPGELTVIVNTADDFSLYGSADQPGHRHGALYAGRHRQSGNWLGHPR